MDERERLLSVWEAFEAASRMEAVRLVWTCLMFRVTKMGKLKVDRCQSDTNICIGPDVERKF